MLLDHDADNCGSGATQDVMTAIEAVMRGKRLVKCVVP